MTDSQDVRLLSDRDIAKLSPAAAVQSMRDTYVALHEGRFTAPQRLDSPLGTSHALFSFGGYQERGVGFRFSGTGSPRLDPITVTYRPDGALEVIVVGDQFLGMRAGAIGGAGVDALAAPGASRVAIIGSGRNGWWHVWATTGVRQVADLRVYSRDPDRREAFARRAGAELGLEARAVADARSALDGADIVILSTDSRTPVIDQSWVSDGAHVSTFGPKSKSAHECPPDLLDRVGTVSTDIPTDLRTGDLFPEARGVPIEDLGAVLAGAVPGRTSTSEITLFLLTGLGGTEVVLAQLLGSSVPPSTDPPSGPGRSVGEGS